MAHILCVMASPRKSGNSASAALDALDFLHAAGHTSEQLWLCDYAVAPCVACGVCDKPPYACPLDGKHAKSTKSTLDASFTTAQASAAQASAAQARVQQPRVPDAAHELLERIRNADAVLLASPVYFYGPPALCKALIDRSQRYWAVDEANQAGQAGMAHSPMKPAFMILTAARLAGPKLFDASLLIYNSFFSCMGFAVHDPLCLRGLDEQQAYAQSLLSHEHVRNAGAIWISKL